MSEVRRFHSEPSAKVLTGRARRVWFHRAFFPELLAAARHFAPDVSAARHVVMARAMTAHVSAETGEGIGIYNHNPGNIHFAPGVGTSDWYTGTDHDGAGNAYGTRFAAYSSRRHGVWAKVAFLRYRTPGAWRNLTSGDVSRYFLALRDSGYLENPCGTQSCTDDEVISMTRARLAEIERDTADLVPTSLSRGLAFAGLGALVGAFAYVISARRLPRW